MRFMPKRRRAQVSVLTALCLGVLVCVVGLALDGGLLLDQRRRAQAAADASALAAAADLYANAQTGDGLDPNGTATASALSVAAANGYGGDGVTSVVTVNVPPAGGDFAGRAGYVEVIVQYNQGRAFSGAFGDGEIPVRARAVARGRWATFPAGILLLDPTSGGALTATGGGTVTLNGGAAVVNSDAAGAVAVSGGGSLMAPQFDLAGSTGGGGLIGPIRYAASPTPDPFAYLPLPDPAALTLRSSVRLGITGDDPVTLSPGVYAGGIAITGAASVTLLPGIYYLDGGGFTAAGQGALMATGVMLYNAPATDADVISITGQAELTLNPPAAGLYRGISLFQAPSSRAVVSVAGNGGTAIGGTFYAARATLSITGTGSASVIGSQYVCYGLALGGDAAVEIDRAGGPTARARYVGLVE